MKGIHAVLVLGLLSMNSWALTPRDSAPRMAARDENESYLDAAIRSYVENSLYHRNSGLGTSVYSSAKPVAQVTYEQVPEWDPVVFGSLQDQFERIRDIRFIEDPEDATFPRRSSWMYPDDGCFARASLMIQNLGLTKISVPKVYVFGNLKVNTTNHPRGSVTWWYHVVPIVSLAGEPWVLDPAVESRSPMKLTDWLQAVNVNGEQLQLAICQGDTFSPYDDCWSRTKQDTQALDMQKDYLRAERRRLNSMGRDAARELGDFPPWLAPAPVSTPAVTAEHQPEPVVPSVVGRWKQLLDGFRQVPAPAR